MKFILNKAGGGLITLTFWRVRIVCMYPRLTLQPNRVSLECISPEAVILNIVKLNIIAMESQHCISFVL